MAMSQINHKTIDHNIASDEGLTLLKALCSADAYQYPIEPVRIMETHISWVLLTGKYAYKIKKPVNFGFLDFSTLEKRKFYCEEEIRLNRRLAGYLYLDVVPIAGTALHPKVDGKGVAIEYAVKMLQFPGGQLLCDLAERGELSADHIDQVADIIAHFHESIARVKGDSPYGDSLTIKHWFDENFTQIKALLHDEAFKQLLFTLEVWGKKEWRERDQLLQQRKQQGHVRECHGDLHLSNITLIDNKVTPFDCIEFNPSLRWIDTMNEIAFLVMDLFHQGYDNLAYRLLNRYLQITGDYQGVALLRYYLVYRAMVRAKVALLKLQENKSEIKKASENFTDYLKLAERFTNDKKPILLLTHGFSGSGKSTFAQRLVEEFHALQIRSDTERKRMFGFHDHDKTGSGIADGIYSEWAGFKTYQLLAELVKSLLQGGISVIIDATFLANWQRSMFKRVADSLSIRLLILDFQASEQTLISRVQRRENDVSEATVDVLRHQQEMAESLSDQELKYTISIDTDNEDAFTQLVTALKTEEK